MYKVTEWYPTKIIVEVSNLKDAKRVARNQGHTGEHNGKYYAPVARVDDERGFTVYNPRFIVGKHDNFKKVPFSNTPQAGPRKCSHGNSVNCPKGCN